MPIFHLGPTGDAFAGVFGGVAAALVLGGPILLRWQRNRQQFLLTQAALSRGVTNFPKGQPYWLVSLRQGIIALALGIALLIVGATASWLTWSIDLPQTASTQPSTSVVLNSAAVEPAPPLAARFGPPPPNPQMEEWHRMKAINSLSLMSVATGFVLSVLGIARISFAKTERRHEPQENAD